MTYDVARVRGLIPALGDGWIHLDAVAGMQPPENVVSAVSAVFRRPRSAPGGPFASSCMSGDLEAEARRAVADLVGADPRGVVLGPGPAPLLRRLADAVGDICSSGDEIVVSRLDDAVNVAPWLWAARRRGVTVRWAEIDIETCELPVWQFDDLLTGGTRVVALTAASGQVGTRVDVGAVAERTRAEGALLVVDACASAAYGPARIDELGADVVGFAPASRGLRARGSAPVRASRGLRACESRSGCDRVGLLLGAFPCAGRVRVCASRGVRASGARTREPGLACARVGLL